VTEGADGKLLNFEWIGYVVITTSLVSIPLLWQLQRGAPARSIPQPAAPLESL